MQTSEMYDCVFDREFGDIFDEERRTSCVNFLKGKYLEEYMVLNMETGGMGK